MTPLSPLGAKVWMVVSDHTHARTYWRDLCGCRKRPYRIGPSHLTKGKLMKTVWKADWFSLPQSFTWIASFNSAGREEGGRRKAATELQLIAHLLNRSEDEFNTYNNRGLKKPTTYTKIYIIKLVLTYMFLLPTNQSINGFNLSHCIHW